MQRRTLMAGIATALTFLAMGQAVQAAPVVGTQEIVPLGRTTSDTGDINTAQTFTFRSLTTTANNSGDFVGTDPIFIGNGSFSIAGGVPSVVFQAGNPFGTFAATSFTLQTNGNNAQTFLVTGTFTPSTSTFPNGTAAPASLVLNFTQNGGPGTAIGTNIILASPGIAGTVPEPASVVMLGLGLVGVVGLGRLRRKSS